MFTAIGVISNFFVMTSITLAIKRRAIAVHLPGTGLWVAPGYDTVDVVSERTTVSLPFCLLVSNRLDSVAINLTIALVFD